MGLKNLILNEVYSYINEGRLEDIKAKYPEEHHSSIDTLSQNDPSGNNKYLQWMVKVYMKDGVTLNEIINAVDFFHQHQQSFTKRDINQYKSYHDLIDASRTVEDKVKDKLLKKERDKIYEDDKWVVIVPRTHEASCQYGKHSNWCVSTSNDYYFRRYTEDGMLAFVLWKQRLEDEPLEYKIATHIEYSQPDYEDWDWYDKKDNQVDNALMKNILPKGIIDAIKNHQTNLQVFYDPF